MPKTIANTKEQAKLMADPVNVRIIKHALGVLGTKNKPYRNHYVASNSGQTLLRCHQLADAGILHFSPNASLLTNFLVTEAGAKSVGYELDREDASMMSKVAANPPAPHSEYGIWRSNLRATHLAGKTDITQRPAPAPAEEASLEPF